MLWVPPSETEGSPQRAWEPAGSAGAAITRGQICRRIRPLFEKFDGKQCCYVGASRFPRCEDEPGEEP